MNKIPEGYTSLTPFIVFDDTTAAIDFYKKSLNAMVNISMPSSGGNIVYAELQIGTAKLMIGAPCSEVNEGEKTRSAKSLVGSPVSFYVYVENVQTAFDQAKASGMAIKKGIEDMFWGDRMGTLTDPFGIDWTVAEHIRDVPPAEIEQAMQKMAY